MSMYGLDILIDRENEPWLIEINGIKSGMHGFRQIYGDNRVQEKVWNKLREKFGEIRVFDSENFWDFYSMSNPLKAFIDSTPSLARVLGLFRKNNIFKSKKAEIKWMEETIKNGKSVDIPFERYKGEMGVAIMYLNHSICLHNRIPVNDPAIEEIAENKILQYLVLKDTPLHEFMPFTTMVGLGFGLEEELDKLETMSDTFIKKPVRGSMGRGIVLQTKEDIEKYKQKIGRIRDLSLLEYIFTLLEDTHPDDIYLKDQLKANNFNFELATSVLQPYIPSRRVDIDGQQETIRAIVCCGEFIDAYSRISPDFKANLSGNAKAEKLIKGENFKSFCENIVRTFEKEIKKYGWGLEGLMTAKQKLYGKYFNLSQEEQPKHLENLIQMAMSMKK